ncbi:MAG: hypothetical protein ACNA7M_12165 [Roseovarius sp.]
MSDAFQGFDSRLKAIGRKRTRLAQGYVSKVGKDGLIVFRPKRRRTGASLRGLLYLVLGFTFFKAVIIAHLGGPLYGDRLAQLAQGSIVEQAGAVVMQPDPVSQMLSAYLRPILR